MDIKTTKLERLEITCPITERRIALDHAYTNGYRITISGLKSNGTFVDSDTFHLVAEKELK